MKKLIECLSIVFLVGLTSPIINISGQTNVEASRILERELVLCGSAQCPDKSKDPLCRHCIQVTDLKGDIPSTSYVSWIESCLPPNILQNTPSNSSQWLMTIQYDVGMSSPPTSDQLVSAAIKEYTAVTLLEQFLINSDCPKVDIQRGGTRVLQTNNTTTITSGKFLTGATLFPETDMTGMY